MKSLARFTAVIMLILSACGPSRSTIETEVAQAFYATQTAMATNTFTPTASDTPTDTLTPSATNTLTPTATATNTPTPTLPPETQTAIAKETQSAQATLDAGITKTAVAQQATATREQYVANITATAKSVAATRTEQAAVRTSTAAAIAATKAFLAEYKTIDYRELVSYADAHIGEKVQIRGRVFNVVDNRTLQVYIAGTYEAIYIELNPLGHFQGYTKTLVLLSTVLSRATRVFKTL